MRPLRIIALLLLCGLLVVMEVFWLADFWRYRPLEEPYKAYLMRYQATPRPFGSRRHVHAVVRITFPDGHQVDFNTTMLAGIEAIPANEPLKILVQGTGKSATYEVDLPSHLYGGPIVFLALAIFSGTSAYRMLKSSGGHAE